MPLVGAGACTSFAASRSFGTGFEDVGEVATEVEVKEEGASRSTACCARVDRGEREFTEEDIDDAVLRSAMDYAAMGNGDRTAHDSLNGRGGCNFADDSIRFDSL